MNQVYPGGNASYPSTPPEPVVRWQLHAKTPYVTYFMIASCVLIFIAQYVTDATLGLDLPALYGMKINEAIIAGQYWRLLTPMWLHGSITHIFFNMYALYVIGRGLEQQYGHLRYAILYLVSGFAGNVMSFLLTADPSLGASTAIFGLVAAEGIFIYQNRKLFRNARAMLGNVIIIVVINLGLGLVGNMDNNGHLGGLLGGLLLAWFGGPLWKVSPIPGGFELADERDNSRMIVAGAAVALLFGALALFLK
ncbi:MAG: rhomboid family intramembrane serine protease [Chloroflexi bacterium]|nr:rhomboid family intramembrane serine protease [Chloroflexota bacterium]